jgi:hypothetical protein
VQYITEYTTYKYEIPASYWEKTLTLGFKAKDCKEKTVTFDVITAEGEMGDSFLDAVLEEKTVYQTNIAYNIRVYYYHPVGNTIKFNALYGNIAGLSTGTETLSETITFEWGKGVTSKYKTSGTNFVSGNSKLPKEIKTVEYQSFYYDFIYSCSQAVEDIISFWFDDKSAADEIIINIQSPSVIPDSIIVQYYDYDTGEPVQGVAVYVYGHTAPAGFTDQNGVLTITGVSPGEIPIVGKKNYYYDTDQDDIETNDIIIL